MVFLFPGILFRRSYYSGKFSKQFGQGNLLERFLWTIFCSVVNLIIFGIVLFFITEKAEWDVIHTVDFSSITNIFVCLATSQYPDVFYDQTKLLDIGILLLSIYFFSLMSGYFSVKFVRILSVDLFLSTLRFNNELLYLSKANKENKKIISIGDVHVTYVDVLLIQKDKEELYRGILKTLYLIKKIRLST